MSYLYEERIREDRRLPIVINENSLAGKAGEVSSIGYYLLSCLSYPLVIKICPAEIKDVFPHQLGFFYVMTERSDITSKNQDPAKWKERPAGPNCKFNREEETATAGKRSKRT